MDFRVDQKGKYYTERVTKESLQVIIATATNIIRGTVHVMRNLRLKDELNNDERFIAVTGAEVYDMSGQACLYSSEVLILNKDQLVWVLPQEESQPADEEGGDGREDRDERDE
jgi:hypothetical protein